MMEKLEAPQTHLGLKEMIKEVDEDQDGAISYREVGEEYFKLSGRISRNIGENIFQSYTGSTSENTDFHVLVA